MYNPTKSERDGVWTGGGRLGSTGEAGGAAGGSHGGPGGLCHHGVVSYAAQGPGWWQASDGRWYPPPTAPAWGPSGAPYAGPYGPYGPYDPGSPGAGSLLLNVIWLVLSGIWLALLYAVVGLALCCTIIGIPFGLQCFKLASFALWPFGRYVVPGPNSGSTLGRLGNVIWFVVVGAWMAIAHLVTGVALCFTVIGIPLGLGNFKLIPIVLFPFGKVIVGRGEV
jgi:uncharacterized membrane protein YccF (DUF307 family)